MTAETAAAPAGALRARARRPMRDSNLELLRIFAMLGVVAHHYVVHGCGDAYLETPLALRAQFLLFFGAFGKVGVNCFLLLSAYFLCRSHISGRKLVKLLLEIEFYQVGLYLIFGLTGRAEWSVAGLLGRIFLPVQSVGDRFIDCYLIFYLCIPFLNRLVAQLDQKRHLLLVALLVATYSVISLFPPGDRVRFNYVTWFVVLYFVASYLRFYPGRLFSSAARWGILSLLLFVGSFFGIGFCTRRAVEAGTVTREACQWFLVEVNRLPALALSVCLFLFFRNLRVRPSRGINTLASATFGVLLLHDNGPVMRKFLWGGLNAAQAMQRSAGGLLAHAFGCVLLVYAAATLVDLLRIFLLERPVMAGVDWCFAAWGEGTKRGMRRLWRRLFEKPA